MAMEIKNCFVVMPTTSTSANHTSSYWEEFYKDQIKHVVEKICYGGNAYKCVRIENSHTSIKNVLVTNLISADVVIAVLTDYDRNVLYELGMRHITKSGTLILLEGRFNQKKSKKFPSDLNDCGISYYQENKYTRYLEKIICDFIYSYEADPYKSFMPYELLDQTRIPYNTYFPHGFRGISIPKDLFYKDIQCNILAITLHEDVFSSSIDSFIKASRATINLLFTTNNYTQLTRALSLDRTIDDYIRKSGTGSKKYIEKFRRLNQNKANSRNVKTYNTYPFGLYFQVDDIIWFIPLWNSPEHKTTSAYDNMCLQVSLKSPFGQMLYNNFMYLWENATSYP